MQWNSSANGGFTKGEPWLPVQSTYRARNAEAEKRDPNSIYSWYVRLLKLRHDNPAFRDGIYIPLETANPNVFAFGRRATTGEIALVLLNTSATPQTVHIKGMPGTWPHFKTVLLASPAQVAPASPTIKIAAYGVLIAKAE